MLQIKTYFSFVLAMILLVCAEEKPALNFSGWGWLTMGQVKESEFTKIMGNVDFNEKPLGDIQAGIQFSTSLRSRTICKIHVMGSYIFPVVNISMGVENAEPLQKSFSFSLLEASLQTNWRLCDGDTISVEFGYFPVKYNPEAKNLGEYLFRSNAYPALLVSGFEVADKVKLAGVRTGYRNHARSGSYKADLFFNTETDLFPTMDLSLSSILGYTTPRACIDFSSGVSFFHLIPFDHKRITPAMSSSYTTQSASFVDSITGDTTNYTFRGVKAAARITIDPKVFFRSKIFGDNDLKLYGESAILGIKNYPGWYSDIWERIPVMIGFNLPAFKLLDVFAAEVQYFPMPYQNSHQFMWKSNSPVPYFNTYAGVDYYSDWSRKTDDDWKWSLYASKTIKNFRLSGQIASDHISRATYMIAGKKVYTEICPRTKDWYYMLRCGFFF